jgi:AraC-like DNA-binding protein
MHYHEQGPGEALAGLVKAFWSLAADAVAPGWFEHRAVPDGCVEIIRRLEGRSRWDGEQPGCFAVGLIEQPASFEIETGARFVGMRLWPWTWSLLSPVPLDAIRGRWAEIDAPDLLALCRLLDDPPAAEAALADRFAGAPPELGAVGLAISEAGSVGEMRRATGMSARALQRWFERHVGLPPRLYLRLLRFQRAFASSPGRPSLADHAFAHGFADQAHMAREYRRLAGTPAGAARRTSKGPFLR